MENMPVSYVPHGDSPGSNDNIPLVSSAPRPGAGGFGRHRAGTDHATVPPRDGPTEPSASLIRPSLGVESNGFLRVTCSCSESRDLPLKGFWRRDQEPAGLAGIAQVRTTLLCLPETVPQSHQPASSARPLVWNLTAFCV
jgi:hypothetical protein